VEIKRIIPSVVNQFLSLSHTRVKTMAKGRKKGQSAVSAADFVKAWMKADTLEEIAEEVGLAVQSVYQRYTKYTKAGIKLPDRGKPAGRPRRKIEDQKDDLNALIASLTPKKKRIVA
jgi:hypothetical protein